MAFQNAQYSCGKKCSKYVIKFFEKIEKHFAFDLKSCGKGLWDKSIHNWRSKMKNAKYMEIHKGDIVLPISEKRLVLSKAVSAR